MKKIFVLSALIILATVCGKKKAPATAQTMGSIPLWDINTNRIIGDAIDMETGKPFPLLMEHTLAFRYDAKAGKYALECIWENKTDIYPLQVKSEGQEEIILEYKKTKVNTWITLKLKGKQWEVEEKGLDFHWKYGSKHNVNIEVFFMEKHLLKGAKKN